MPYFAYCCCYRVRPSQRNIFKPYRPEIRHIWLALGRFKCFSEIFQVITFKILFFAVFESIDV